MLCGKITQTLIILIQTGKKIINQVHDLFRRNQYKNDLDYCPKMVVIVRRGRQVGKATQC
jgi:hypothetical protein